MDRADLAAIWGREFSETLGSVCQDVVGQDGWEVWTEAGVGPLTPGALRVLTDRDVERLTEASRDLLEEPGIEAAMIRAAVRATIHHAG